MPPLSSVVSSYLHHDQLGSVVAITNTAGVVVERLAYDPWGKRRFITGAADTLDAITGVNIDRGFTMHEHIDEMGIINMNGRIYDPLIARFMSADKKIQSPFNLKSFNRYSYVWNNPLKLVDLNGYDARDTTTGTFVTGDNTTNGGTTPGSCRSNCTVDGNGVSVIPNSPNPPGYVAPKPPTNTPVGAGSAATQNPNPVAVAPVTPPTPQIPVQPYVNQSPQVLVPITVLTYNDGVDTMEKLAYLNEVKDSQIEKQKEKLSDALNVAREGYDAGYAYEKKQISLEKERTMNIDQAAKQQDSVTQEYNAERERISKPYRKFSEETGNKDGPVQSIGGSYDSKNPASMFFYGLGYQYGRYKARE